jgi:hypothetical protein
MASSVIGALRVNLGIDTASFQKGLEQSVSKLSLFGVTMRTAIVASVGTAVAALGGLAIAIKGAINEADEMGKAAQKFGIGVEELSRLKYAADLSDVSLQGLGTSIGRLSRNMQAASTGTKTAQAAFNALGVEFQNTDGTLRSSSDVLLDISDKFARMPDGAEKTAIAMQLMGRSGAEMIPLLNAGGNSIREMGDEAERAGLVISQDAARSAEEFNDNLTRLNSALKGVAIRIASALLPALADIAEMVVRVSQAWEKLPAVAREVADRCIQIFKAFSFAVRAIAASIPTAFVVAFQTIVNAAATAFSAVPDSIGEKLLKPLQDANAKLQNFKTSDQKDFEEVMGGVGFLLEDAVRPLESIPPIAAAGAAAVEGLGESFETAAGTGGGGKGGGAKDLNEALDELKGKAESVFEATRTPIEKFQIELGELNSMLDAGLISWDTYHRAVDQAEEAVKEGSESGRDVFRNLSNDFGDMTSSIIQGTESIQESFSNMLSNMAGDLISSSISTMMANLLGGLFPGFKLPGFANGTNFAPGGLAWVGEAGRELVNLPRGSQVIPQKDVGMGGTVNNVFSPNIDARGSDAGVVPRINEALRMARAEWEQTFNSRVMEAVSDPRSPVRRF